MGYHQAGFNEIVGVDNQPQPNYPFTFIQADALEPPMRLDDFDLIHASPPCQAYSTITPDPTSHPDLIAPIISLLEDLPSVIENVPGAPLEGHLRLCGSMFGMQIQRHRYFRLSFAAMSPPCNHYQWDQARPWTITGALHSTDQRHTHSWKPSFEHGQELMGVEWVQSPSELVEAIPPTYTRFIGEQFLAQHAR